LKISLVIKRVKLVFEYIKLRGTKHEIDVTTRNSRCVGRKWQLKSQSDFGAVDLHES